MGIPGLIAFLKKQAPNAFTRADTNDLRGKIVGIDLSITIYRGAAMAYRNGVFSHLETLAREIAWLLELECKPVYVIDGDPPIEKAEESQRREGVRRATELRLEALLLQAKETPGDVNLIDSVQKLQRQCFRVTAQMRSDVRSLLEALGICYVVAPGEAERCLAHMMRSGAVEIAFTEDVDVLVCGSPSYLKNAASLMYETEAPSSIEGRKIAEHVNLQKVLEGLQISYEGLLTMSVMAGCDFAPKLKGLGPATAWKLVKRCSEDVDVCFDGLKAEDQVWRERYKRAVTLLRYDKEAILPELSEARDPSRILLEEFYTRLGSEGSLTTLRYRVECCCPSEKPRPTKLPKLI